MMQSSPRNKKCIPTTQPGDTSLSLQAQKKNEVKKTSYMGREGNWSRKNELFKD
jgi:hypothetical protein